MVCKSCGSSTDRDICPVCGQDFNTPYVEDFVADVDEEYEADYEEKYIGEFDNHSDYYSPHIEVNPDNKHRKRLILLGVFAFVAILLAGVYLGREYILMTVLPREYAVYSLVNSVGDFADDVKELPENILGMEIDKENDYTFNGVFRLPDCGIKDINLCYAPSENALRADVADVKFYGENVGVSLLWDNRIIGLQIPKVTEDTYFAVSSGRFGNQMMNARLSTITDVLKRKNINLYDTDLSFENIIMQSGNDDEYKEFKTQALNTTYGFIKTGKVSSQSTGKLKLNGKKQTVHNISMVFEGKDIKDYILNITSIAREDAGLKKSFGDGFVSYVGALRKNVEKQSMDYPVEFDMSIKGGKVVRLNIKNAKLNKQTGIRVYNTDFMPDCFHFELDTPKRHLSLYTSGNIQVIDEKIDYTLTLKDNDKTHKTNLTADFVSGNVSLDMWQNNNRKTFAGNVKRTGGFELGIYCANDKIELNLKEGAVIKILSGDEYMIADKALGTLMWDFGRMSLKNKTSRNIVAGVIKQLVGNEKEKQNEKESFSGIKFNIK